MTEAEVADVQRDVMALLRAALRSDFRGVDVILEGAGERGSCRIAMMLLGVATEAIVRWSVTVAAGGSQEVIEAADSAGIDLLLAQPEIRAVIDSNIARLQAGIVGGG